MPRLLQSAPYFPVHDVARSADEYDRTLGFQTDYIAGAPAEFAIVSRDGLSVMLRRVGDSAPISPNESQGGTWDVFFWVDNADALFEELRDRNATVAYAPIDRPEYHMREFAVRDAAGYVLGFGQALPSPLTTS